MSEPDWASMPSPAKAKPAKGCSIKLETVMMVVRVLSACCGVAVGVACFFGFPTAQALVNLGDHDVRAYPPASRVCMCVCRARGVSGGGFLVAVVIA